MSLNDVVHSAQRVLDDERVLDFTRRAYLNERMDEPCSYEELRACLDDLRKVNQQTLAYGPTLRWIGGIADQVSKNSPLHIVDVGCGGGDMLRRVERWADGQQFPVKMTGIDLNPNAVRAAKEFTSDKTGIRWVVGNAYELDAENEPIDIVISSLFTHHLSDQEIVRFLRWMENVAHKAWFISDLSRSRTSYELFKMLAAMNHWHSFVQHDGPVSIRRGFTPADWDNYLGVAGIPLTLIKVEHQGLGRLCISRSKLQ